MYQIDVASAVTAPPPSTVQGAPGFFTDGNPAAGQPATIVPAEFLNALMRELLNLLHAAQIKPDKAQFDQVAAAVKALARVMGDERYARKATTLAGYGITDAVPVEEKGQAGGVATLDEASQVPLAQLPGLGHTFIPDGYQRLPSGLMIQWGYRLIEGYGELIYFPIAFPTACLRIVATDMKGGCYPVAATLKGPTAFIAYGKSSDGNYSETTFQYLALGY